MDARVFLLLVNLMLTTQPGYCSYSLEVQFVHYRNPANIDFQHICCDLHTLCISPCDVYFTFCYRAINTPPTNIACWQHYSTQSRPYEAGELFPPAVGPFYPCSPVSNPMVFSGSSWPGSFQLLVSSEDEDFDPDDLIDRNMFNMVMSPDGIWTPTIAVQGFYNAANIALRFRVSCNQDFYGPKCEVFCRSRDDSEGHYNCDVNGEKVCLSGWSEPTNNCLTPICAPGCKGYCTQPGECLCNTGWHGPLCQECIPSAGCSPEHGRCDLPGECICDTGYGGPNCDQDLDVCGHQQPCLHGATCTNAGPDDYNCTCLPGYTGTNCETEINECDPPPCVNGGTCFDQVNGFICQCAPGWTGDTCNEDIDDCDPNPCENGGNCTDLIDGYSCNCQGGFIEPDCVGHKCDFTPCAIGSTCIAVNTTEGYECACVPGYTGDNCTEEIDECDSLPCQNGGTCSDLLADYHCTCPAGFTGKSCQIDIDECIGAKCSSYSICLDGIDSYTCVCYPGYTGRYCELEIDHCNPPPCKNGATCNNFPSEFTCHCAPGYTGELCDAEINDCKPDSCQNNGTCIDLLLTFTCSCPPDWTGSQCEEPVSACETSPCPTGQVCVDESGSFYCEICNNLGCERVGGPGFITGVPTPTSKPAGDSYWKTIVGVVIGSVFILLLLFFLLLLCHLCCKRRKRMKHAETLYQPLGDSEFKDNPTYIDPQELISSNSLSKTTTEEIPLVDPSSCSDYGSPSNNTALTAITGDTSTLRSRSGYYDHLKTEEEGTQPHHDQTSLPTEKNED